MAETLPVPIGLPGSISPHDQALDQARAFAAHRRGRPMAPTKVYQYRDRRTGQAEGRGDNTKHRTGRPSAAQPERRIWCARLRDARDRSDNVRGAGVGKRRFFAEAARAGASF